MLDRTVGSYFLTPPNLKGSLVANSIRLVGTITKPFRHRGLFRFARFVGCFADTDQKCTHTFAKGCNFCFNLRDYYWSRNLAKGYRYEPELEKLFQLLVSQPYALLDCGANYGYWSIYATREGSSCVTAVAIEASPDNILPLRKNAKINGDRFEVLHRALFDNDESKVAIRPGAVHHAASEVTTDRGTTPEDALVQTISLQSCFDRVREQIGNDGIIIVKLDVEGAERRAMEGAGSLLDQDFMIVYEEHANDRQNELSYYFINELKTRVFFIDDDGVIRTIEDPMEMTVYKTQIGRGYNCIAVRYGSRAEKIFLSAMNT